jgi:hypothetical protein
MANTFQGVTSGLAELKNFYQGPIVDQFSEDVAIWRGTEKGKYPWSGLQVIRPLKVKRNPGIGAIADGGTLPQVGRQTTVQAIIPPAYNYLRFGITGPMIEASKSDIGSFVRGASFELEEGYNDMKSDCNRQLSWKGNGTLASANAATVASTIVVLAGRESAEPALKFLDVSSYLDIVSASTGLVIQSGITILSITSGTASSSTATVVFDQAVTCSAGDLFIRSGSLGNEISGLLTQLDGTTSTVFSIVRATYLQTQGNVTNVTSDSTSTGTQLPLSLNYLQQTEDECERRGGRGVNALYSDFGSRRMYQKLLTADKRYVNVVKGDGGFADENKNYLEWNGKPWVADKDCPQRIFFLPDKFIERYVLTEMQFADETGSMYIAAAEQDQLEVRIRFFANLFNSKAAGSGCVQNYVSP